MTTPMPSKLLAVMAAASVAAASLAGCTSAAAPSRTTRDDSIGPSVPTTVIAPLPTSAVSADTPSPVTSAPWAVDSADCADPTAPTQPITGTLTIGSVAPQTGGLISAVYAPLIKGFKAYIDHANATHLLGQVQLNLVVADDQGDPALTPAAVAGLIAAGANVVSGILGTANNLAVRQQLNRACVPQLMALGNSAQLGDVAAAPWTMDGLVPVTVETTVYVNSIVRLQGEHSRVSLLVSDDGDGKTFANSFTAAAASTNLELAGQQVVEPDVIAAPSEQLRAIAVDAPDAIVASLTGAACATFLIELANVQKFFPTWHPTVYMSGGCADPSILSLAGDAAEGVYSSANLLTDEPTFVTTMTALGITDGLAAAGEGWTAAEVTVAILVQAQHSWHGLTRASIIDAARHLSYTPSLARPGVQFITNGADDPFPAESLQVIQYHPADHGFVDVGPLVAQFES